MHGRNIIVVTAHDLREWVKNEFGIIVDGPFQAEKSGSWEMKLFAQIDNEETTFNTVKKLTKGEFNEARSKGTD